MDDTDKVKAEIDRRKLQKLVDNGVVSAEDIANAPIYVECPYCGDLLEAEEAHCIRCGKRYE